MIDTSSSCPCSSNVAYSDCCEPIIKDHRRALTAEMLMRSRYCGFVRGNSRYLLASWHASTNPKKLSIEENRVQWLGLKIHKTSLGQAEDSSGTVVFTATYLENGYLCQLHEESRFVKEDGLWYYLDGESVVNRQQPSKNGPCPCGSGRKFKRCCMS